MDMTWYGNIYIKVFRCEYDISDKYVIKKVIVYRVYEEGDVELSLLTADTYSPSGILPRCWGCWLGGTFLSKGVSLHSASGDTLRHHCSFGHFDQTQTSWKVAMWCCWSTSLECSPSVCQCWPSVVVPLRLGECAQQVAAVVKAASWCTCESSFTSLWGRFLAYCATLPAPVNPSVKAHPCITGFQREHWPQPSM